MFLSKKTGLIAALLLFCMCTVDAQNNRMPAVAGSFYPGSRSDLDQAVTYYLQQAPASDLDGRVVGLMVPHAGYRFSAATAAAGYKTVSGNTYDLIVVLAPSHRDPLSVATIHPGNSYQTPLGKINIDHKMAEKLVNASEYIRFSELGHRDEHAIEVQLPFVQKLFPNTPFIPIVVGNYNWKMCKQIGEIIAKKLQDRKVLIIASTDLYHGENYEECQQTNEKTLQAVVQMQPEKLCNGLLNSTYQACGGAPVVIMQIAAQRLGAESAHLIARTNSNDVMGVKEGYVVGYGAVAVCAKPERIEYSEIQTETQVELLKMARKSIETYLDTGQIPSFTPTNDEIKENRGAFVTLTIDGQLRGCIGQHESNHPLYQLVPYLAVAAAVDDPRFAPVTQQEFEKVDIKISVYLTNVYPITDLTEFKMGVHGIIMRKNGKAATYLPEVPIEAGWTSLDQEMTSLCQKAGLPTNAWKSGAKFWVYRTMVFDKSLLSVQ